MRWGSVVERDHGLLGDPVEQGTAMGLVGRSVLSSADACDFVCVRARRSDLSRIAFAQSVVALRTLADRNFCVCCIIIFCAYGVLYANTISLPALLQSLFGYDATTSGLVLSPAGVFAIGMLVFVGVLLSRGFDARYLMAGGLLIMGLGNYWMAHLNLEISPYSGGLAQGGADIGTVDVVRATQRRRIHLSA